MQDERLNNILSERDKAIQDSNNTYQDLINNNKNLYDQQLKGTEDFETTQNGIAQGNYEQSINQINQNKDKAQKQTDIENQKAYNSYQKVINPYGVEQESLGGLGNSGYSETFKLGAYNSYQNRVGRANVALREAFTQYDNEMAEAKRTYDTTKANNALQKLQMQLEYAKSYNDTNNTLSLGQLSGKQNLNNTYDNRYMNMINQINTEKQREEQIRQFNEQLAYQKERDRIADEQWQKQYDLSKQSAYSRSYSGGSSNNTESLVNSNETQLDDLENINNAVMNTMNKALSAINGKKKVDNSNVVSASKCPNLTTNLATNWANSNIFNKKNMTEQELENQINYGLKNMKISKGDANAILRAFGL